MKAKKIKKNLKKKAAPQEKTGSHKGQAMMEYLMTYGLALFVILAVLAILVVVVLPALKPPENCQFLQNGLSCNQKTHRLLTNGAKVDVVFQLDNQFGRNIVVTRVGCVNKPTASVGAGDATVILTSPPTIVAGGNLVFGNPPSGATEVECKLADPAANSNFKGSVVVMYHYSDEVATGAGIPERMGVASITGSVQSSTPTID